MTRRLRLALGLGLLAGAPGSALGVDHDPRLVSRVDPGSISDSASALLAEASAAASADGRYVVFVSRANNVVAGQVDDLQAMDVFLRDRVAGQTVLVSHDFGAPLTALGGGYGPVFLSADGGYVLFSSYGTTLAQGQDDANGGPDLFLWERATDTMALVSHRAGQPAVAAEIGHAYGLGVSADGRYVLFTSSATDLVPGQIDDNHSTDVFLWDRLAQSTVLVSHAAGAPTTAGSFESDFGRITPDGDYVLLDSQAEDLVPGQVDDYATGDVFLFHRPTGVTRLVSHARGAPTVAHGGYGGAVSNDGRYVAFSSFATDLVGGQSDRNQALDVFLYDGLADSYTLVSHRPDQPLTTGNDSSRAPTLSADGRWVAFLSPATDLGPGVQNDNGFDDVYLFDRQTGTVALVSRAAGTTRSGDEECWDPVLSPDGRWLAFTSQASDLVPGQIDANRSDDVFLYEVETATLRLVSHDPSSPGRAGSGLFPLFAADGGTVFFLAFTRELTRGLLHGQISETDLFAHEVAAGTVSVVSLRHPSLPALAGRGSLYQQPFAGSVSDDGRYVVFDSPAEDLAPGLSEVQGLNVFLYDRQNGTIRLVSHRAGQPTVAANLSSYLPTISADGRFVAFASSATDLVPGQLGPLLMHSVFVYDVATGANTLVSHHPSSPTRTGNNESWSPVISADGRFVAFRSLATDLVPRQRDNISVDVFLYDRLTGSVSLVSHRFDDPRRGTGTCADVFLCLDTLAMSRDGAYLAYASASTQIVPSQLDDNNGHDVFLYERATGLNRLVSRAAAGAAQAGNGRAEAPAVSADGRYVAFSSQATDHLAGQEDVNGAASDVFVYDRVTGSTLLASRAAGSPTRTGDAESSGPALNDDGSAVAFSSRARDLVPGQAGPAATQVFVFAPGTGQASLISHGLGAPRQGADGPSGNARLSRDGRRLAFVSSAIDLVPGQQGPRHGEAQVFLHDRATDTTLLASHVPGQPGGTGNRPSGFPNLSGDGDTLYFDSRASDLTEGDYDYVVDPFSGGTDPLYGGWDVFVFGFNRAPVALAQAATLREDTSRAIVLAGTDPDGDGLAYALASPPGHGTVTGTPPQVTYTPTPDYHGPDGFTFTVSDGHQTSAPAGVALTVEPDSGLAAADAAVVEGDAGTTSLIFTVTANPTPTAPLSVSYRTEDGTATAGSDYLEASGTLTFAAGQTSGTVAVTVNGDTKAEESETLTLRLLSAVGADIEDPQARGEITDDDDTACTRPPLADIDAPASLCLNRTGEASVADAGAGARYAWTVTGGSITGGEGTARIGFAAESRGPLGLSVTVTNAAGCAARGSAAVGLTEACYAFHALAPCRAVDTRAADGPTGGPALQANQVRTFAVAGLCGVPADAVALAVNLTVTGPTDAGNLRVFASGTPAPLTSVLNFVPFRPRASLALVALGSDGALSVRCDMPAGPGGQTHFILDTFGYFR